MILRKIYQKLLPEKTRIAIRRSVYLRKRNYYRKKIIQYCREGNDPEKTEIADYLETHDIAVFPYEYAQKYREMEIPIYEDDGFKYVIYHGKRLYMKKASDDFIRTYVRSIMTEQDPCSPHAYFQTAERALPEGAVIADIGCAEGNFSLDVVENAARIYLFECNEEWIPALEKTFAPWRDKVEIVRKFVSDEDGEGSVSIDGFFAGKRLDCIKADVEGAEEKLLKGGKKHCRE